MQTKQRRPKKRQPVRSSAGVRSRQRRTSAQRGANPSSIQVVYTDPKPFNRNRFLLRLATVVAVVLALLLGMSIFFKVENVYVSGVSKYTAWDVKEASGIQEGENLLTLSRAKIAGQVKTNLAYVDDVRVGIKLPDTVNIEVIELDIVYAIEASDSSWWLMTADGRIVERTNSSTAKAYTRITGVKLEAPELGAQAVAAEEEPEETRPQTEDGSEATTEAAAPVTAITGKERLSNVIAILQQLEGNGVIGEAAAVDVSDISNMQLWYGQRYQIILGDNSRLDYKIQAMKAAIDQMGPYQSGVLDVSFTLWPDEVGYTPFS